MEGQMDGWMDRQQRDRTVIYRQQVMGR
jgi:hypothetical protein